LCCSHSSTGGLQSLMHSHVCYSMLCNRRGRARIVKRSQK